MFGPDMIPAAYLEERLAAEKLKREAKEKRLQEQAAAAAAAARKPGQPDPSSLSQVFAQQRPPMSRPGSSTLLGGIYQSLAKTAAGGAATPTSSQASSRGATPCPGREREMTAEEKRAWEERWREIDMMNMPKWH